MFAKILYACLSALNNSNTWYVSDDGSDDNDCHSASTPCRNLQTVLNRAADGADIYVTSDTLSLDGSKDINGGFYDIVSNIFYTLSPLHNRTFSVNFTG